MNTPVRDIVVLCVDSLNAKFGELGKLLWHDWKESGMLGVQFADGSEQIFHDGVEGPHKTPAPRFYRHDNEKGVFWDNGKEEGGPRGLIKKFLSLKKGTILDLSKNHQELFEEKLPIPKDIMSSEIWKEAAKAAVQDPAFLKILEKSSQNANRLIEFLRNESRLSEEDLNRPFDI